MDRVVCVSEGQAEKVRRAGVRVDRVTVIRNAVRAERFDRVDPADRQVLEAMFPQAPDRIVGSAGRLSPEKGFGVLVQAAAIVIRSDPGAGFIHFGDGPLRNSIRQRIAELGLEQRFILAGLRDDLDRFIPHWDLCVLPSFTEGLPTVVLESYAAGVPVVATAVGGTPEAVADGVDGYLVPPGDPAALAARILDALKSADERKTMGRVGRERIRAEFTFDVQASRFQAVCDALVTGRATESTADSTSNFHAMTAR
jgi:glycosyltransferase involved in cell wall biosynthesis